MGRRSTGIQTCEDSNRIELSFLLKQGYFKKHTTKFGSIKWTDRRGRECGSINLVSVNDDFEKYLKLAYTLINHRTQQKTNYNFKIKLTTLPSNLGKGEVLYFLCPETSKRCRVLYRAYGYPKWKSREAYQHQLYYQSQTSAKYDIANNRYWAITRRLEKIKNEKHVTLSYNGELTRKALLIDRLLNKQRHYDQERFKMYSFPIWFRDSLKRDLGKSG